MFKVRLNSESPETRQASHWALTGMGLQLLGTVVDIPLRGMISPFGLALSGLGALCLVFAVFKLARAKNRNPLWAILGLFSLLGWCLVAFLEDRSAEMVSS